MCNLHPPVTHSQRIAHGDRDEPICTKAGAPTIRVYGALMCCVCHRPVLDTPASTR